MISDNNRLTSIQTTGGNRRNENNTNNEGGAGGPVQQQEMNDIQVRSVVNNAANMNAGSNNAQHEATIEVAIASPEDEAVEDTVTTAALVNNTGNNSVTDKDNNAANDEIPQVKISNL